MNFGAAFNQDGSSGATLMEVPLTTIITQNPDAKKYVKANVELGANINPAYMKVAFLKQDNSGLLVAQFKYTRMIVLGPPCV